VAALIWLVRELVKEGEPTIVFASTRHHVEFLYTVLQAAGMSVACIYGAMDQVLSCLGLKSMAFCLLKDVEAALLPSREREREKERERD